MSPFSNYPTAHQADDPTPIPVFTNASWLALAIGNSRLHWGKFTNNQLQQTWNTPHLTNKIREKEIGDMADGTEVWIASVVPAQTQYWQSYPQARFLQLADILLPGMYPTLGIDRALAVWGAISTYQTAALVIDAGTALTFTAATPAQFNGGAILPGLALQLKALHQGTAALCNMHLTDAYKLPPRWANDTETAIASGIMHTLLAGIQAFVQDWRSQHPVSVVIMTGGDGDRLHQALSHSHPDLAASILLDSQIIFKGIQAVKTLLIGNPKLN